MSRKASRAFAFGAVIREICLEVETNLYEVCKLKCVIPSLPKGAREFLQQI